MFRAPMIFVQRVILLSFGILAFTGCKKEPLSGECSVFIGKWKCVGYRIFNASVESNDVWPGDGTLVTVGKEVEIEFEEIGTLRAKVEGDLPLKGRIVELTCRQRMDGSYNMRFSSRIIPRFTTGDDNSWGVDLSPTDTLETTGIDVAIGYPPDFIQGTPVFYFVRQ